MAIFLRNEYVYVSNLLQFRVDKSHIALGPHYSVVGPESSKWLESYNIFNAKTQTAFNRCDFRKLRYIFITRPRTQCLPLIAKIAMLGWPDFDQGFFDLIAAIISDSDGSLARSRICCDLMNLFFMIDVQTDDEDARTARQMLDIVRDALMNPQKPRPSGEWIGGEVSRE